MRWQKKLKKVKMHRNLFFFVYLQKNFVNANYFNK